MADLEVLMTGLRAWQTRLGEQDIRVEEVVLG